MKQIVDNQQRRSLRKAGIFLQRGTCITHIPETIGELIEWICEHQQIKGISSLFVISEFMKRMGILNSELLDSLVELVLKIQESK